MIISLVAWIYITFLSYSWGKLFLRLALKNLLFTQINNIHPVATCFTGIILITTIAGILSFFLPLGLGSIQLFFLLPALLNYKYTFTKTDRPKISWLFINKILFVCCVVTILIMSTFVISHPDTLGYHIQIIKWIEEYRIVPGIANLNPRLGFQSNWFITSALFSFNFTGAGSYVYLNSLITLWLLFFFISRMNYSITKKKQKESLLWIVLMTMTLSSYTQVMLTATSASPDYITCIYTWLGLYFLYNSEKKAEAFSLVLVILFSFFAVSIKLSALPITITGLYAFIKLTSKKRSKTILFSMIATGIIVISFFVRNAITSGYILYPATFPNIVNRDWKIQELKAQRERVYVTAFAKTESEGSDQAIAFTNNMKLKEWLPIWWHNRALADKAILALTGLCFFLLPILYKKIQKANTHTLVCTATCLTGTIFWFIMGPDPRFGFGFLIGLVGLTANMLIPKSVFAFIPHKLICSMLLVINAALLFYIIHRYNNYFSRNQLIYASGIKKEPASSINCGGATFNIAAPYKGCGANSIPCIEDSCKNFSLRGSKISEGFKPKIIIPLNK